MVLKFSVDYSERELEFLQKHGCEILSEMKLSRVDFGINFQRLQEESRVSIHAF